MNGDFVSPDPGEEQEKEKVMDLREKVASKTKKGGGLSSKKSSKSKKGFSAGGIILPLLLIALLGVGGFIAWELIQLNNRLNSMDMGAGAAASMPGNSNSSYEYAVDFIFDSNLNGRMSQRGKEGWQVVGSRRTQDTITGQLGYEFIFMRKAK